MATHTESDTDAGLGTLVADIMQDARQLVFQQLKLFEVEVKSDVQRINAALVPLIAGGGILLAALVFIGLACAHLLTWANPDLPLWGAYALVGIPVGGAGAWLIYRGKAILDRITVPGKTLEALKENIQWKRKN